MVLNTAGIAAGWQVETMPGTRLMTDAIVMPDGNILFINGAATGVSIILDILVHICLLVMRGILGGWLWQCCQSSWPIEC